jgi:hypothetical protein
MDQDLFQELTAAQKKEFEYYASANFELIKRIYNRKDLLTTSKSNTEKAFFAYHPQKGTFLITGNSPMEWINFAIKDKFDVIQKKSEINNQLDLF